MKSILLTGFEPYADCSINPSQLVTERWHGQVVAGAAIQSGVLPVVFGKDVTMALALVQLHQPLAVISLGLDPNADAIYLEEIAVNQREDGAGILQILGTEQHILYTSFNTLDLALHLCREGHVARTRKYVDSAYLCNHLYFNLLHHAKHSTRPYSALFVHLPLPADLGGRFTRLTLAQLNQAIGILVSDIVPICTR